MTYGPTKRTGPTLAPTATGVLRGLLGRGAAGRTDRGIRRYRVLAAWAHMGVGHRSGEPGLLDEATETDIMDTAALLACSLPRWDRPPQCTTN
jgi:hypothetical protein